MRNFSIAGLQSDLANQDNLQRMAAEIRSTKRRYPWIDMMVFGELSAYGFDTQRAEPKDGAAERIFCKLARDNDIWLVPGSWFQSEGDKTYNASAVIDPSGKVVSRYRKIFPFLPYEAGVTPGDSFCVFDIPGVGKFGLSICYDIWFPELARSLVWLGAEVLINTSVTYTIDRDVELALARATAAVNQCYVFNVNGAGSLGRGRSIVTGPGGEVIHQAEANAEVFVVEVDLDSVERVRKTGWHGLAQALKSFRDNTVPFPVYQPGAKSAAFAALGPMAMRESGKPHPRVP
jgi:predicted amidohydrolase